MEELLKSADYYAEINKFITEKVENKYEFLKRVIMRIAILKKAKEFEKERVVPDTLINSAIDDVMQNRDAIIPDILKLDEAREPVDDMPEPEVRPKKDSAKKPAKKKKK